MEVCSTPKLHQLCLEDQLEAEAESLSASTLSDFSDTSSHETHTQKARRFSGCFTPRASAAVEPPACEPEGPTWSAAQSAEIYNIPGWGAPYFAAGENGHLVVTPDGGEHHHLPRVNAARGGRACATRRRGTRFCPIHKHS